MILAMGLKGNGSKQARAPKGLGQKAGPGTSGPGWVPKPRLEVPKLRLGLRKPKLAVLMPRLGRPSPCDIVLQQGIWNKMTK